MEIFNLKKHATILPKNGRILIAPLNWGIGHATRCIPIIKQLIEQGFTPLIASDGDALVLLQKVFPELDSFELPSYQVRYAKTKKWFTIKLLQQIPKFLKTYRQENIRVAKLVKSQRVDAIISDNRFGVYHPSITSIYITHQLQVKSSVSTVLTTKIHQNIINNFDRCWVPDIANLPNLSGELSQGIRLSIPLSFIGILSQFNIEITPIKYDILVLLSGPEPQRSILENILFNALKKTKKKVCFVRGVVEDKLLKKVVGTITLYNFLVIDDLQKIINQSELVIARSGYSTIMDLAILQKKAFFIPTPGQAEQIYLAEYLEKQGIAPYIQQEKFSISLLKKIKDYKGFVNRSI